MIDARKKYVPVYKYANSELRMPAAATNVNGREYVSLYNLVNKAVDEAAPTIHEEGGSFFIACKSNPLVEVNEKAVHGALKKLIFCVAKYSFPSSIIQLNSHTTSTDVFILIGGSVAKPHSSEVEKEVKPFSIHSHSTRDDSAPDYKLHTALAVIENHRGSLTAFSTGHGEGVEFTVRLPLI